MSKLLKVYDRSRVPLYLQVASVMRERVDSQHWLPGQKISTLAELEREFQVARVTVRHAVDLLCEEGLLRSQQGRGTFVSERPPDRHWLNLATEWDAVIAQIKNNVLGRIQVDNPPPFPDLNDNEGTLAEDYIFLRSVLYKESRPYGIINVHLARRIYERDPDAFLDRPALLVMAGMAGLHIRDARESVVIGAADPQAADHLNIALGAPTVHCRIVVTDTGGIAIYVADVIYRSDAIKMHIDLLGNAKSRAGRSNGGKSAGGRSIGRLARAQKAVGRQARRERLST